MLVKLLVPQEYTGWFRRSTLDQLRDHIRARFMGLMPDELARESQGLPRQSWAPVLKTVTWKDDVGAPNNDNDNIAPLYDVPPAPVFNVVPNVDSAGTRHHTIFQTLDIRTKHYGLKMISSIDHIVKVFMSLESLKNIICVSGK